jgi:hypothetical protein
MRACGGSITRERAAGGAPGSPPACGQWRASGGRSSARVHGARRARTEPSRGRCTCARTVPCVHACVHERMRAPQMRASLTAAPARQCCTVHVVHALRDAVQVRTARYAGPLQHWGPPRAVHGAHACAHARVPPSARAAPLAGRLRARGAPPSPPPPLHARLKHARTAPSTHRPLVAALDEEGAGRGQRNHAEPADHRRQQPRLDLRRVRNWVGSCRVPGVPGRCRRGHELRHHGFGSQLNYVIQQAGNTSRPPSWGIGGDPRSACTTTHVRACVRA